MKGPRWERQGVLARSSRPGYPSLQVPLAEVDLWIEEVHQMGIRSIICLLHDKQLSYYDELSGGLIEHYRRSEFEVAHVPIVDPAHDPAGLQQIEDSLDEVFAHFGRLPGPLLVHCSAGVDRTGRVVADIVQRLDSGR